MVNGLSATDAYGQCLGGDVETLIPLLGTTNRILSRPAFDRMLKDAIA